jgi:hypothetical protein
MTDDASHRARNAILARRAKFVAAALAGISIAACKDGGPFACLKVAAPRDAETEDTQPQVCLSPPIDPDAARVWSTDGDAAVDASAGPSDAAAGDASAKDAGPRVLKPDTTLRPPTVCLSPPIRPPTKQ